MKKKTRKKTPEPPETLPNHDVFTSNEYDSYLKEHRRRLRQLEREASGMNMEEPWSE